MNELELAYTAGIIDGEGCIDIYQGKTSSGETFPIRYTMRVAVGMGSPTVPNWLASIFGGNPHKSSPVNPNRSAEWRWSLSARKAQHFLELIYPYLVLKKDQVDIALDFQRSRRPSGCYGYGKPRKTEEEQLREECLWVKLKLIRGYKNR